MTHYFQPGQGTFRKILMAAMPTLLAGEEAKPSREEQMKEIIDNMNSHNWKASREKLIALLKDGNIVGTRLLRAPARRHCSESQPPKARACPKRGVLAEVRQASRNKLIQTNICIWILRRNPWF